MDSPVTLTHIAALLVGIIVTYLLVGGSQKTQDRGVLVEENGGSSSSVPSKNAKKKAKKKKSKAAAPAVETSPPEEAQQEKVVRESPAPAAQGGKKKKKKGKVDSTAAAPAKESKATPITTPTPTPAPTPAPKKQQQQQQQPKVEGEQWTTIAETKKDRKSKRPVAATTPNPNSAAAAASTETVTVDVKKIGIIIGPKGATLKGLEEATGCKLDVNAPSKDDSRATTASVTLTADKKEALVAAKNAIRELTSKGYATILQSDNFGENFISVHPRYLNEIVGPSGQTIKALQTTLDVKITIPPTDWKPNTVQVGQVKMVKVGIAGSKEGIAQCKQAIEGLMRFHHSEISHPGMIHQEVYVPSEFFHCIIGTRGSEIKHIKGNYKVQVYMPNEDSITENVLVVGKSNNVEKAISYIQTLMDRDAQQREAKYNDEYY